MCIMADVVGNKEKGDNRNLSPLINMEKLQFIYNTKRNILFNIR